MMNLMRETDRKINDDRYPSLIYPEIYLLEHGYRNFYKAYPVSPLTLRITANLEIMWRWTQKNLRFKEAIVFS